MPVTGRLIVTVNGQAYEFTSADVLGIRVEVGRGDDSVTAIRPNVADVEFPRPITVFGGAGDDTIVGGNGPDSLDGGAGHDDLRTVGSGDAVGGVTSTLLGGAGNDTVRGGSGDDSLDGGAGDDSMSGNWGDDTIAGGNGNDSLVGWYGNDALRGDGGADDLDGSDGNDDVRGGVGRDTARGGNGDDDLYGDNGRDDLHGDDGADDLRGGRGRDAIAGGAGRDRFGADDDPAEVADRGADDDDDPLVTADDLPPAVTAAFADLFANAQVAEVEREADGSTTRYEVYYLLDGTPGEVTFTADGNLIEGDVPLGQVPQVLLDVFNAAFPGVQVTNVEVEPEDDGLHFRITYVQDGVPQVVEYDATGTVDLPGDDDDDVDLGAIPGVVNAALQQLYPGAQVTRAELEIVGGVAHYELHFTTAGGDDGEALVREDGTVVDADA